MYLSKTVLLREISPGGFMVVERVFLLRDNAIDVFKSAGSTAILWRKHSHKGG